MRNRLFRTVPRGSGIAFAAAMVALMSFHGLPPAGDSARPSRDRNVSKQQVGQASAARSEPTAVMTKADYLPMIFHNPFP